MSDRLKAARYRDFLQRAHFAPDPVYLHRSGGWQYILIHPFADESDILARLKLRPEDCSSVDAWWAIDGDATLVESYAQSTLRVRPPGQYAFQTVNDPAGSNRGNPRPNYERTRR